MRIPLAPALCFVFVSTCPLLSAVAQSTPTKTNPIQPFGEKLADARLSAALRGIDSDSMKLRLDARYEPAPLVWRLFLDRTKEKAPTEPMPCDPCAHILILRPPSNLDSKMIREVPENLGGPIITYSALPPCPQDFRGTLTVPGASAPMLMSPSRLGPLFLSPRKPFHPDHP